jgi:endonuclease G
MRSTLHRFIALAGALLFSAGAAFAKTAQSDNMALGNPSGATAKLTNSSNYLSLRLQFALSYNKAKGGPNWVSWHVEAGDLGMARRGNFRPDASLPSSWQIRPNDYTGSGYDRGHQCPSGDRTSSRADNDATFNMSNMLPQTADLNERVWEKLESYSRNLVHGGKELYIIAGGYGTKGTIHAKVNIPAHCWKVIVVLPEGNDDLHRISASTRVIAVDMPNEQGIGKDKWQKYIVTANAIEKATGYQFFANLPSSVRTALEKKKDPGHA